MSTGDAIFLGFILGVFVMGAIAIVIANSYERKS